MLKAFSGPLRTAKIDKMEVDDIISYHDVVTAEN